MSLITFKAKLRVVRLDKPNDFRIEFTDMDGQVFKSFVATIPAKGSLTIDHLVLAVSFDDMGIRPS